MEDHILDTICNRERLRKALAKMPNNYTRLAVVLWLMGYRQYEIAEVFGCAKQNIQQYCAQFKIRNGLRFIN